MTVLLCLMLFILSVFYAECHYAKCRYAECLGATKVLSLYFYRQMEVHMSTSCASEFLFCENLEKLLLRMRKRKNIHEEADIFHFLISKF